MKVKLINTEEVYKTLVEWWEGHGFPVVSPSILPESTFVCYNEGGEPVYSMCFYHTDSDLCWIGWQLSNPKIDKKDTKGCFDQLFKAVEIYARHLEYKVILTTSSTPSVIGTLENNDYNEGDKGVNHYLKTLK